MPINRAVPDFAEFIIGPAEGRTRWLNPGYSRYSHHEPPPKGLNFLVKTTRTKKTSRANALL